MSYSRSTAIHRMLISLHKLSVIRLSGGSQYINNLWEYWREVGVIS